MAIVITHTGQTGVERGADRAARAVGFDVSGVSSFEQRDEIGLLPPELRADLTPCARRGARSALRATLEGADVLVIAVPKVSDANVNTGIEALRRWARVLRVPHRIIDPATDLDQLNGELRSIERSKTPLRVMITGPRLTRWHEGERFGWRVVVHLSLTPSELPARRKVLVAEANPSRIELANE